MNKTTIRLIIAVLVILLFIPSLVAQDKEKEDTPYWYISYAKIAFAKMDSLVKFQNEYFAPVVVEAKKQGTILDYKMLFHHTGSEYTTVFMTKFPSWAGMEKGWRADALKAIEPDEAKRKVFNETLWYFLDEFIHYDEIYTEVTK